MWRYKKSLRNPQSAEVNVLESSSREEWLTKQKPITSKDIEEEMQDKLRFVLENNSVSTVNQEIESYQEANKHILDKAERLRNLGFYETPTAKNATKIRREVSTKKESIVLLETEIELTNKYILEFPGYKFVPQRIYDEVCEKYNLYTAETNRYIKEIPEKNLGEIENFFSLIKDTHQVSISHGWGGSVVTFTGSLEECIKKRQEIHSSLTGSGEAISVERRSNILNITAPIDHFDLTFSKIDGRTIRDREVLDPIVTHPVEGGVIIVSAWDKEAEIPEIQNPQNN